MMTNYRSPIFKIAILFLLFSRLAAAQDNPRHLESDPKFDQVKTLQQNWSDETSNWFYNVPQGSQLMPYSWFVNLEQADNLKKFAASENIQKLGYIARKKSADNPDALPIGFVKDAPFSDGKPSLGLTCAACHTGQIIHDKTAYLIDGGPSLGDFESLLKELAAAMEKTAEDAEKFKRFSTAVLGPDASEGKVDELMSELTAFTQERKDYNDRNLSKALPHRFGYGRVDAFGAIFNEVSVKFIDQPQNLAAANAPVSYPCLWDTPQHERVQWNGAAKNRVSPHGDALFGTKEVGALGRNSGEVLGVFGNVKVNKFILPIRYKSTINKSNLMKIEDSIKELWSPKWPDEFGKIDVNGEKWKNGRAIFEVNCQKCHADIDRKSKDRKVELEIWDVDTDPQVLENFKREVNTGRLKRRLMSITNLDERFGETAPVGKILKHVVERSILDLDLAKIRKKLKGLSVSDLDLVAPDYSNMIILKVGDKQIPIPFDGTKSLENQVKQAVESGDASLRQALEKLLAKLKGAPESPLEFGYKARPLNGIWATAPYLHNGSVPTLTELLKAPGARADAFHIGSQVFDPVNVGFVNDPKFPKFDATKPGNLNDGHNHGSSLTADQKLDLIEYLKSL